MTATFYVGDAVSVMNRLPEKSVDLVLTSPPFLALRSYLPADHPDKALEGGSQATPGAFIDWLIDVVEACDRVLAPHGSLCVELGDTYAGSGGGGGDYLPGGLREGQAQFAGSAASMRESNPAHWRQKNPRQNDGSVNLQHGVSKPDGGRLQSGIGWPLAKSLSLIPELFRLTLVYGFNPLTGRETERWRLRNVVRWVRPNPPVGALGDKFRPATSELMVFCKSAKRYFDLDAVREPNVNPRQTRPFAEQHTHSLTKGNTTQIGDLMVNNPIGSPPLDWWNIPLLDEEEETRYGPKERPKQTSWNIVNSKLATNPKRGEQSGDVHHAYHPAGAPPLDWWNIPPGGYEGAHYAVFPPELCVKPVKAMCPEKVCRVCGEPSRRIVEKTEDYAAFRASRTFKDVMPKASAQQHARNESYGVTTSLDQHDDKGARTGDLYRTLGFSDCGHDDWRPGLVLDPFGGSGTTALVATGHGRDCWLIDLDERNYDLALERVGPLVLSKGEVAA